MSTWKIFWAIMLMKLHCLLDPLNLSKGLLSKWDKFIPWSHNTSWQRRLTNSSMWPASFIMLCTVRCSPSTWALERSGALLVRTWWAKISSWPKVALGVILALQLSWRWLTTIAWDYIWNLKNVPSCEHLGARLRADLCGKKIRVAYQLCVG